MPKQTRASRRGTLLIPLLLILAVVAALAIWRPGRESRGVSEEPVQPVAGGAAGVQPVAAAQGPPREEDARVELQAGSNTEAFPVERDPRDLHVLVVGPNGLPRDGVPVCLFVPLPDGQLVPNPRELRVSGAGKERKEFPVPHERDPALHGLAIWAADRDALEDCWEAVEGGTPPPPLEVGVLLPQRESPRLALDFANWPEEPLVLVLDPETLALTSPLRVEVRHRDGSPAPDIPVQLLAMPVDGALGNIGDVATARSGADGVAWIERCEPLRISSIFGANLDASAEPSDLFLYFVTPELPITNAPRVPVDDLFAPDPVARLDLPPLGRLVAEVTDFGGRPLDGAQRGLEYRVNWTAAARPPKNRESNETFGGRVDAASFDLGPVGLGMTFSARVWPRDGLSPGDSFEVDGPTAAGQTVTLSFELGERYPRLAFRVLDGDGQLVANETLEYAVRDRYVDPDPIRAQRRYWQRIETDAGGWLVWTRGPQGQDTPRVLELRRTVGAAQTWGSIDLPLETPPPDAAQPWPPPPIEIGAIRLGSDPLPDLAQPVEHPLAEGLVTDGAGAPIRGVSVYARGAEDSTNLDHAETDAEGRFDLRVFEPRRFTLSLYHEDYVHAGSEVLEPGSTNLVFELQLGGRLRGRLVSAPPVSSGGLDVFASCSGERCRGRPRPEEFEISGLPPGTAEVWIEIEETGFELVRFEDVEVRAGEALSDPRFEALDASSLVKAIWLRFERSDGEPFTDPYVWMSIEGFGRGSIGTRGRARKQVLVPADAKTAVFDVGGRGQVEIPLEGAEVLVRF